MPTPTKGPRLGGGPAHERLLLANLATALFEHDRISTTEAKAKRLRPLAERLITIAKKGDLHARRQLQTVIRDKDVVHKLLAEIGPANATRPGGYTRIVKTNPRKGDNAPMAIIELVGELQSVVAEAEKARGTRTAAKKAPTGRTREIAEDAAAESATAAAVANSDSEPTEPVQSVQSDDATPEEGLESIGLSGDEAEEAAEASEQVLGGEPEAGGFETTADDAGEAGAPPEAESDANAEPEK